MKGKIRNYFYKYSFTKRLYLFISQTRWTLYYGITLVTPIIMYRFFHKNPIFLIFTPEHANLGDHAIAYAEKKC